MSQPIITSSNGKSLFVNNDLSLKEAIRTTQSTLFELLNENNKNYTLKNALVYNRTLRWTKRNLLPFDALKNLKIFSVPIEIKNQMKRIYNIIKKKYHLDLSSQDFMLALIGFILKKPIVSFDHHILSNLANLLDIEGYWPQDIKTYGIENEVLLDANVILHILINNSKVINRTKKMKKNAKYHLFALDLLMNSKSELWIPDWILEEVEHVFNKKVENFSKKTGTRKYKQFHGNQSERINQKNYRKKKRPKYRNGYL